MKTIYRVKGYIAHATKDNYANGCELASLTEFGDDEFSAATIQGLIALLAGEFVCAVKDVTIDACDEDGRIDIQVNQRVAFKRTAPSPATLAAWRNGDIDIYLTGYSFQVERVQSGFSLEMALIEDAKAGG